MNLTGQGPYKKGAKRKSTSKARPATATERKHWERVRELGCVLSISHECYGRTTIHHCGTGAGGRKDHMKVIGLCYGHHLGHNGIDGKRFSKRDWQAVYGSEDALLKLTERRLLNAD